MKPKAYFNTKDEYITSPLTDKIKVGLFIYYKCEVCGCIKEKRFYGNKK